LFSTLISLPIAKTTFIELEGLQELGGKEELLLLLHNMISKFFRKSKVLLDRSWKNMESEKEKFSIIKSLWN
jgi:uncharacterized protein YrzB (UPF0473 family)